MYDLSTIQLHITQRNKWTEPIFERIKNIVQYDLAKPLEAGQPIDIVKMEIQSEEMSASWQKHEMENVQEEISKTNNFIEHFDQLKSIQFTHMAEIKPGQAINALYEFFDDCDEKVFDYIEFEDEDDNNMEDWMNDAFTSLWTSSQQ